MRKVFLDDLPRKEGIGALKGKAVIDWKGSLYYKVRFLYDEVDSFIEIIEYIQSKKQLIIKYEEALYKISITSIINGRLGNIVGKYSKRFKVRIGDIFKDDKRDLIITDREYRRKELKPDKKGRTYYQDEKWYKYTCNVCGWTEGWIIEGNLLKGDSCSCCCNPPKTVVPEINSIYAKAPWMMRWISEENAKKYTPASSLKIDITCPYCGKKKKITIYDVFYNKSIGCVCGDGTSYAEKFMYKLLKILNIDFKHQPSKGIFEWCNKHKYDFYVPKYNMIIEMHGMQHYKDTKIGRGKGRTFKEEQENDKIKRELALSNAIKHYIELDCRYSNLEWIRNSILNSCLSELFDLSKINWYECDIYAIKSNKLKDICEYWNNKEEWETAKHIGEAFDMDVTSIISYLKKGTKLGWCSYDPKEEMRKSAIRVSKITSKKVEIFKDRKSLGIFESCNELSRQSEDLFGVKLNTSNISAVCLGKLDQYKSFTFKYVENNE